MIENKLQGGYATDMDEYAKSIIPIIEANYEKYTETERYIADYFLKQARPERLSAELVSKELSVSVASLSRFAKKCGFGGYREFTYEFRNSYVEKSAVEQQQSRLVLDTYQNLLNKIYSLLDEGQIHRIVTELKWARRVFVCGRGSSGLAAEEMATRFRWIGIDMTALRDNEDMRMQSVFLNRHDLMIGLSLSGTKSEILYMLDRGFQQGARTMLITGKNRQTYEDFCNEVLLVPSLQYLNHGNLISPQFPLLLMIDILYAAYVNDDRMRIEKIQREVQRTLRGNEDR
jgi:DNA-binding MurR/RpiR family transcriptional regulator